MKAILDKFKEFGKSFVFYFTHIDALKIISWVQYVFVLGVTISLSIASRYWFYISSKSKAEYAVYVSNNRSLLASYTVCSFISFLFLTSLIAWGVGKLVKKKFNLK